jgi:pyruvate dehydrogenase E1 component alpha subunit
MVEEINAKAKAETDAAVKFAEDSPAPTIAEIAEDVYWETDNQTDASKIGHHFFA